MLALDSLIALDLNRGRLVHAGACFREASAHRLVEVIH